MLDFVKALPVAVSALLLCGCSINAGIGSEITSEEFETDYSSVYAERVVFKGFRNREYESALNLSIDEDVTCALTEFDGMAQEIKNDMPENMKSLIKITQLVKRNSNGFISLIEEHYVYIGGTHGNVAWFPRNICITEQQPHNLALKELFSDDTYMEKINTKISEMVEEEPEKYSQLWDIPMINEDNEHQFYITDDDLVIYFPPYTLSYYAKGFIEFPIRLTEIEGFLKPEYRSILLNKSERSDVLSKS